MQESLDGLSPSDCAGYGPYEGAGKIFPRWLLLLLVVVLVADCGGGRPAMATPSSSSSSSRMPPLPPPPQLTNMEERVTNTVINAVRV